MDETGPLINSDVIRFALAVDWRGASDSGLGSGDRTLIHPIILHHLDVKVLWRTCQLTLQLVLTEGGSLAIKAAFHLQVPKFPSCPSMT